MDSLVAMLPPLLEGAGTTLKLFFITLALYLVATAATAFSWNLASYTLFRFLTGAGMSVESGFKTFRGNALALRMVMAQGAEALLAQLLILPFVVAASWLLIGQVMGYRQRRRIE